MRAAALILATVCAIAALAPGLSPASAHAESCREVPLLGLACPAGGLWKLLDEDGRHLGYTHGADAGGPEDVGSTWSPASRPPACVPDTTGSHHVVVIYARAFDDADQYSARAPQIRDLVHEANARLNEAAVATGDRADLRVACQNGTVRVAHEVLPTPLAHTTFTTLVQDLQQAGYSDHRVKHWVFFDENICNCGIGHVYGDDRLILENLNNGAPGTQSMFAASFGVLSSRLWLHELAHTLGAVQNSAPHSTGGFHCTDGRDVMCYNDGGPAGSEYATGVCESEVFDCGHDDYFHTAPVEGSYLASHWNLGSRFNRYLEFGRPVMDSLTCDAQAHTGDAFSCSFVADDDSDGVAYLVDWGDGTSTREPSEGHAQPGVVRSATHVYAQTGEHAVVVRAVDTEGLESTARTRLAAVMDGTPTMDLLSCPTSVETGVTFSCTFRAQDASSGVRYEIDWGDGNATMIPIDGHVSPGITQTADHQHEEAAEVIVRVRATDNGTPPATSPWKETTMTASFDLTPPTFTWTHPQAGVAYAGCAASTQTPHARAVFVQQGCAAVEAHDDRSHVAMVRLFLDGALVGLATQAPFVFDFDVATTRLGAELRVEVWDAFDNVATGSLLVETLRTG